MSYHSTIKTIFGHFGTVTPTFFGFTPFGTTVLEPNLKSEEFKEREIISIQRLLFFVSIKIVFLIQISE